MDYFSKMSIEFTAASVQNPIDALHQSLFSRNSLKVNYLLLEILYRIFLYFEGSNLILIG
jgi:hypothetical protein